MKTDTYKVATLSNGVVLINFSSAHSFEFDDGTILPACSKERANKYLLDVKEIEFDGIGPTKDVEPTFILNKTVRDELVRLQAIADINKSALIIIVPLPVMTALKQAGWNIQTNNFRVVRVKDRVNKICYHDKFCI